MFYLKKKKHKEFISQYDLIYLNLSFLRSDDLQEKMFMVMPTF